MKKNHRKLQNHNSNYKKESPTDDMAYFNCGNTGHFISECSKPKKDDHKKKGNKRNNKKSRRDRKVMIVE